MFNFIKKTLQNIYNQFASKINSLFNRSHIDDEVFKELEKILITGDTGIKTTRKIINNLKEEFSKGNIQKGSDLKNALSYQLKNLLNSKQFDYTSEIYLLVGINGSGKTTFAGKLANWLKSKNKRTIFVAGDTFRAAAQEQLQVWANRLDVPVVMGKEGQDPASVVYEGCEKFKNENYDCLIIDTAGRLQNKVNLMKELEKIKKIVSKQLPNKKITTLLTVDSMLGQNSFDQAKIFNESTQLDGIVLTKMDGTGKGGIVFSINQELGIPIAFISFGEQLDQIKLFSADEYVDELLNT